MLKNAAVVDDLEKQFSAFSAKKYDVQRQVKAIEAFEAQAVRAAEETKGKVDAELGDLEKTLKNIESARPFEDLTVVRICRVVKEGRGTKGFEWAFADLCHRMRSLLLVRTSTSALNSSFKRVAGKCLATRR